MLRQKNLKWSVLGDLPLHQKEMQFPTLHLQPLLQFLPAVSTMGGSAVTGYSFEACINIEINNVPSASELSYDKDNSTMITNASFNEKISRNIYGFKHFVMEFFFLFFF